jgi:hypothetical protein
MMDGLLEQAGRRDSIAKAARRETSTVEKSPRGESFDHLLSRTLTHTTSRSFSLAGSRSGSPTRDREGSCSREDAPVAHHADAEC